MLDCPKVISGRIKDLDIVRLQYIIRLMNQRDFLIERLNHIRQQIDTTISKSPTDKEIYKDWKLKELLDHISGWDDVVIDALKAHGKNEPVSQTVSRGINAYNAQTVASRAALNLDQTQKEFHVTRAALIQALNELPDEKFNQPLTFPWGELGTVAYLIEIFVEHEEYHAGHLEQWLKNPDNMIGEH